MRFKVSGVLGCKDAEFEVAEGGPLLVIGPNSAGKSSIRYAMSAVLARRDNPLELPKSKVKLYNNDGSATSVVRLETDDGSVAWEPVKGLAASGEGRPCHPASVGLEDPLEFDKKKWRHLFDLQIPDKELFSEALRNDLGRKADDERFVRLADGIYDRVINNGVEATLSAVREMARQAKRDWEDAVALSGASETYGKQKASNWQPSGWDPEMEGETKESLDDAIAVRRQARDVAMRSVGYDEAIKDTLAAKIKRRPEVEKVIEELKERVAKAEEKVAAGEAKIDKMAAKLRSEEAEIAREAKVVMDHAGIAVKQACPSCGAGLVIAQTLESEIRAFTAEEHEESVNSKQAVDAKLAEHRAGRTELMNKAKKALNEIKASLREKKDRMVAANAELQQCDKAEEDLAKLEKTTPVSDEERSRADIAVRTAEEKRELWISWERAGKAHKAVQGHAAVIGSLETGQLSRELVKGLEGVAKVVSAIGKRFGLEVKLDEYVVTVNGRPVKVCAENERWIARFACQVGIARLTDSPAVLADGAELLFNDRHSSLIELLENWQGKPLAIIAFATWEDGGDACGEVPRVWLESGTARA